MLFFHLCFSWLFIMLIYRMYFSLLVYRISASVSVHPINYPSTRLLYYITVVNNTHKADDSYWAMIVALSSRESINDDCWKVDTNIPQSENKDIYWVIQTTMEVESTCLFLRWQSFPSTKELHNFIMRRLVFVKISLISFNSTLEIQWEATTATTDTRESAHAGSHTDSTVKFSLLKSVPHPHQIVTLHHIENL